ncbi:DUF2062 domain-containing protein [Novosphingobium sp.]|uniref:DUF2062 domain-containing protein n=1 Tax=Novosphingobium sp. TaxID=1874826 RepID=UPI0025FC05CD|nr:DUF2062 domain-containing protein [Novosphingobium sp.]
MSRLTSRIHAWGQRNMPTREQMGRSRLIPKAVLRSELWRFTRRSVPRAVALGLLVGILLPFAQIIFAAILSLPIRANVPIAAVTTFVTNPFTTPLIWAASYQLGNMLLHIDNQAGGALDRLFALTDMWSAIEWLTSEGKSLALGLIVVSLVSAALGYIASGVIWRWWVGTKRRTAQRRARAR